MGRSRPTELPGGSCLRGVRKAGTPEPGKIARALWLTDTFGEEIEADFQRYYGLDYLDRFRPGRSLGWRKLLVFIEHLPPESALNTAIRNSLPEDHIADRPREPAKSPWSTMELLTAALIDELRVNGWMYAQAHSETTIPRPEPISRPGVHRRRRVAIPIAAAMALDPRLRDMSPEQAQAVMNGMIRLCLISSSAACP